MHLEVFNMERELLLDGPARVAGLSLPENLFLATRERAAKEDRPFSWVVRRALLDYLADAEERPVGEARPRGSGG